MKENQKTVSFYFTKTICWKVNMHISATTYRLLVFRIRWKKKFKIVLFIIGHRGSFSNYPCQRSDCFFNNMRIHNEASKNIKENYFTFKSE